MLTFVTSRDAFYFEINKRSNIFEQEEARQRRRSFHEGWFHTDVWRGWRGNSRNIATRQRNSSSYTVDGRVFYHISRVWGEHTVWPCQLCPWSIPWPSARASAEFHEPLFSPLIYVCRANANVASWHRWRCTISSLFVGPQPTISDNYREGSRGTLEKKEGGRGYFCRVSTKSARLSAKLNSSSVKLLTNNQPFLYLLPPPPPPSPIDLFATVCCSKRAEIK